jgi:adenosylmethionine---8-amino-7-oxononanoate aminotransferase
MPYICAMQTLVERDQAVIWHPFTPFKHSPVPIAIERGEGSYLIDENGNRYLDAISSWWVTLHGHGHPYIAEALYKQALKLEQVIFAGFTHEPAVQLAERLLPLLPGQFARIFYSDNGSTSTEVAIKMALQYWWNLDNGDGQLKKRKKILAFHNSYHGDTFGSMSVSDRSVFTKAFESHLFEVQFIPTPTEANIEEIKKIIHREGATIAAFIYEPLVQGAGGMHFYEAPLLDEILNTAKGEDIICIADEVMTGFGRTGALFASHYLQKKPDIICLSKGLTGGTMALGVTAVTDRLTQAFQSEDKRKTFFHGHSFTANPLACSAALASLDLLEKQSTIQGMERICAANQSFIQSLYNHPSVQENRIKNLRCLGTILAFEINQGKDEYLNDLSKEVTAFMLSKGIYLRPLGNTVYIMPPYCTTNLELEKIYAAIESLLN